MAEACVLAGELQAATGNSAAAFSRYQRRLRPFLRGKQRAARSFASSFAPKSANGVVLRNRLSNLVRMPLLADFIVGGAVCDGIDPPNYERSGATAMAAAPP